MMIFNYTLVLEEISVNSYMDTSVCRSGNAITVCKYGKLVAMVIVLLYQVWQSRSFRFVARQPSIITSKSF